jgi:hypothetical protein
MRSRVWNAVLLSAVLAGCAGTRVDVFPPGVEPWETNLATLPSATAESPCPETITFVRTRFATPDGMVDSVHARACIHAPMADVWQAVQDPEVARDHTSVNSYAVINPPMPAECDGDYQTQINAGPGAFAFDFRLCWRHSVAEGLEDAPTLTATRWQKVWGSANVTLMEGSLVTRPLEGHPEITVVEYQYHLDALTANHGTIESFLNVIYGRLVDRVHGRTLP